jgi:hypothetical protein
LTNPRRNRSALHEPNFGGNVPAPFRSDNSKDSNHETTVYPTCESNILNTQHNRRKFRSQTSDNMDRWKSRGGQSQRRERKKKGRRKKIREEKESEEGRSKSAKR